MDMTDISNIIGQFSPAIAGALGGPFAGIIITALKTVFQAKNHDDLAVKIPNDSDVHTKFRSLELLYADLQRAQANPAPVWVRPTLAIFAITGFLSCTFLMFLICYCDFDVAVKSIDPLKEMLAGGVALFGLLIYQIYSFYFGSQGKTFPITFK